MAHEIVLFHSAYGLRPAVLDFAGELRRAGHTVHTPDLYEGATFDDLGAAASKRDEIGIPNLIGRAQAAVAALPAGLVYAGFSMGSAPAELLATSRPGARGAVLMHGALAPADIGLTAWPAGVPVEVHYAAGDTLVDTTAVEALAKAARAAGTRASVHVYPKGGHLFADAGLPDHEPTSARLMLDRVLAFLRELP